MEQCSSHYKPRLEYFFMPFFTAVYNQERLILQTIYALNKENCSIKSEVYNQERVTMAHLRYILCIFVLKVFCLENCSDLLEDKNVLMVKKKI